MLQVRLLCIVAGEPSPSSTAPAQLPAMLPAYRARPWRSSARSPPCSDVTATFMLTLADGGLCTPPISSATSKCAATFHRAGHWRSRSNTDPVLLWFAVCVQLQLGRRTNTRFCTCYSHHDWVDSQTSLMVVRGCNEYYFVCPQTSRCLFRNLA